MIRTFDFIFYLRKSEKQKTFIYSKINETEDFEYDIQGWHLSFNSARKVVTVTNNHTDNYLDWEFIPAEISYASLINLVEGIVSDSELEIRYLYD